jgi:hypothetical protein
VTRQQAVWLLPVALALHNAEEGLTLAPVVPPAFLPAALRALVGSLHGRQIAAALVLATVVPLAASVWAAARPASAAAQWLVDALWATVLLNVAWHVVAAVVLAGYAPGLVTALAVNLPLGVLALRAVAPGRRRALVPAAVLLHLAGTVGLLLIGRALAG